MGGKGMKKKIITLVVWLALTVLYVWNLGDSGRYIGSSTTWALEDYSQMMVEYGGTTTDAYHLGAAMGDMANYKMFCDYGWCNNSDIYPCNNKVLQCSI
jgi:hypothetical protein